MLSRAEIAQNLPDVPRWVEARACLLDGPCELLGLQEQPELAVVIHDSAGSIFVIGRPAAHTVRAAVQQNPKGTLVAAPDLAAWLADILPPDWKYAPIIVHQLPDSSRLPSDTGNVGFLDPTMLTQLRVPSDLLDELMDAATHSSIAATFVSHQPVSFCYAGAVTETRWDIAVDTLVEQRQRGYAAQCVGFMIRHMHTAGKHPVWQAVEGNPASWRLAQKLGFVPVDRLAFFESPR